VDATTRSMKGSHVKRAMSPGGADEGTILDGEQIIGGPLEWPSETCANSASSAVRKNAGSISYEAAGNYESRSMARAMVAQGHGQRIFLHHAR